MIAPEELAVESERAGREADATEIVRVRGAVARVDSRQKVIVRFFVVGRREIEAATDDHLSADLMRHHDNRSYATLLVERQYPFVVPLADVQPIAVEAELRAGVVRASDRIVRLKAVARHVAPDDTRVVLGFAAKDAQLVTDRGDAPRRTGRFRFRANGPGAVLDRVDAARLASPHPQHAAVER